MTELNINRGLSTELFPNGELNGQIIVEEGCWYLCTDTAELFLGLGNGELKRINEVTDLGTGTVDSAVLEALNAEISAIKNNYALKSEIPSVETFATKSFVQEEVGKISIPDDYLTENDLGDYALKSDIPTNYLTEEALSGKGFLTAQDISDKADKSHTHALADITDYTAPDLTGYATQEFVTQEIAKAELADKDVDLGAYYTKSEVDALIPTNFITAIPDEYVTEEELNAKGYLTTHQSLADYALKSEIPTDYLKAVPAEYITETELTGKGFLVASALNDYAKTSAIPTSVSQLTNDSGYITAADVTIPSLDNYALKSELASKADATHTHTGYAASDHDHTEYAAVNHAHDDLYEAKGTAAGMLTEAKSYADGLAGNYAAAGHTHDDYLTAAALTGYATEEYVDEAIAAYETEHEAVKTVQTTLQNTVIPVVEKVEAEIEPVVQELVVAKANDVPFTESKIVVNSVGGFATGDDVSSLTVAQLFAKLLGFTLDSGDIPEEPDSLIKEIVDNKIPMYSVGAGELVEITYDEVIDYTEATSEDRPTIAGFYQIRNTEGEVIESGYQDLTIDNPDLIYIIALPKAIDFNDMVTVQNYDTVENRWSDDSLILSNDLETIEGLCVALNVDISHVDLDKYTLWADLSSGQGPSGKIYRFIIKE